MPRINYSNVILLSVPAKHTMQLDFSWKTEILKKKKGCLNSCVCMMVVFILGQSNFSL